VKNSIVMIFALIMLLLPGCTDTGGATPVSPSPEISADATHQQGLDTTEETVSTSGIEEEKSDEQQTSSGDVPVLPEKEYWEKITEDLNQVFLANDLILFRTFTHTPYIRYSVVSAADINLEAKTYSKKGLELSEYLALYEAVKPQIQEALRAYAIEDEPGLFGGPTNRIISIEFYNHFINQQRTRVDEHEVAVYQIDLIEFYYKDNEGVRLDAFYENVWEQNELYKSFWPVS